MNYDFEKMKSLLPHAKTIITPMQAELDIRKGFKGYIQFHDITDAVSMIVDEDVAPELFEACKRVLECTNVVTILESEYVSVK